MRSKFVRGMVLHVYPLGSRQVQIRLATYDEAAIVEWKKHIGTIKAALPPEWHPWHPFWSRVEGVGPRLIVETTDVEEVMRLLRLQGYHVVKGRP